MLLVVTCLSVCLSVFLSVADLKDGRVLVLERGMNLNWLTIYVRLICHLCEIRPFSRAKVKS